jgi:nitroreductase
MDLCEALRTTGAVRAFTNGAVDDATVAAILDDARFAPSGGNRQGWRVANVKDRSIRRTLGNAMQPVWDEYLAQAGTGVTPFAASGNPGEYQLAAARAGTISNSLIGEIETIPVVLAVAVDLGLVSLMDAGLDRPPITAGASIYPFCWSIVLAARARGLGGVITTFLSRVEPNVASVVGLPPDHALAATIFLGHPVKQPTKLKRRPVSEFATLDRFDGQRLPGG